MVDAAVVCGCDAVKFQSWTPDSLYSNEYYESNPMAKRMVQRFSLNEESLLHMAKYCNKKGIDFSSTPYSEAEVDFLVEKCNAKFLKIASMELNNPLFLEYIAKKGVPIVLSTGMGTIEEIEYAVDVIKKAGNSKICILHCVSLYPVESKDVNLKNVSMLRDKFDDMPIGYSDHTMGCEVACGAVALGAALIEKHFTLDNQRIGWDNQMASEPKDMKILVESCNSVFESLGSYERIVSDSEIIQRKKMRRSIVASKDLKKGSIISAEDLYAKRPGDGISPDMYRMIIGKKLNRDINTDSMILWEYLDD
jgi:N-acetylneuraminate synthase